LKIATRREIKALGASFAEKWYKETGRAKKMRYSENQYFFQACLMGG